MQGNGIPAEVTDLEVEDLVDNVDPGARIEPRQFGLLEDQLAVHDQREQVPDIEHEVQILLLLRVRGGGEQQLPKRQCLLVEPGDVGDVVVPGVHRRPVGELDLAGAPGGPFVPKNTSSAASLRVGISG